MPFVAFHLRMQAAARRQLSRISALRAAEGDRSGAADYIENLQRIAGLPASEPVFALIQSGGV